jgi:hypothetical protein
VDLESASRLGERVLELRLLVLLRGQHGHTPFHSCGGRNRSVS